MDPDTQPVVIQCAVTGSAPVVPGRPANPPATPQQIVDEAVAAWRSGAAVLHLHARDNEGTPTQDPDTFSGIVDGIRDAGCDAVINLSCGTAGGTSFRDERYRVVERLRPQMASLDCGSINFGDRIFEGDVPFLRRMATAFREAGTVPELECFDTGHVGLALQLRDEGLLDDPLRVQFVLGIPGSGVPATPAMVEHLRSMLPDTATWSVCAPGRHQLPMNLHCLAWGGHVRTGLEDNLYLRRGVPATNAQLIERMVRIAGEFGRPIASVEEAQLILALPQAAGSPT